MKYKIRQTTTYTYGQSVPQARIAVRMIPCTRRLQRVAFAEMAVDPEPDERSRVTDFFGNRVEHIAIRSPHRTLVIDSRSEVTMESRELTEPGTTAPVADIRAAAASSLRSDGRAPGQHLYASRIVPIDRAIREYAAPSLADDVPILAGAIELTHRIHEDFRFDPEATDVSTPVRESFAARHGVCQDFAHIMISALRSMGLPAAYVSGYLRTIPAPGQPRLVGADAMHAWVAVWCGEAHGWRGLDPTNGVQTALDHIEVAFGRDYTDVSPLDGVFLSAGHQSLAVAVDVAPA